MPTLVSIIRDSSGFYNFTNIDKNKQIIQRYTNHDDLATELAKTTKLNDAYFCPFPLKAKRRVKENALPTNLIVLDIDASDTSPAGLNFTFGRVAALNQEVPLAAIVFTGGGFHAYVVTDRSARPEDRKTLLDTVERLSPGLIKDRGCTTDPVRLLRVPGTLNHKYDPPRLVKEVAVNPKACYTLPAINAPTQLNSVQTPSGSNWLYPGPLADMDVILQGCQQLRWQQAHPNDVGYDAWLAMLTVARVCADGPQWAHRLSKGYDGYSPEEVDQKLSTLNGGPATCLKFETVAPNGCAGCPHAGQVKSPAALKPTQAPAPATPEPPKLPAQFSNDSGALLFTDPQGVQTMVAEVPVWVESWRQCARRDGEPDEEFTVCALAPCPQGVIEKRTKFKTSQLFLNSTHKRIGFELQANPADPKVFLHFLQQAANHVRATQPPLVVVESLGWQPDGGFGLPHQVLTVEGAPLAAVDTSDAIKHVFEGREPKEGSLAALRTGFRIIEAGDYSHIYLQVLLGLAAPLVELLDITSTPIVNLKGPSGIGKTLGLRIQESVWWRPKHTTMLSAQHTAMTITKTAGVLNSLPIVMDEISGLDEEQLTSLIYDLSQGHPRGRLTKGGEFSSGSGNKWRSIASTAAYVSLTDLITDAKARGDIWEALKARCLDIPCEHAIAQGDGFALNSTFAGNSGVLGPAFMQLVLRMKGREEILNACYKQALQRIMVVTGATESVMRFRATVLALTAFADMILRKYLKLAPEGLFRSVKAMLLKEAATAYDEMQESSRAVLFEVADFININAHLIVIPTVEGHSRMLRPSGTTAKLDYLKGRLEDRALYLHRTPLFKHLRNAGFKTTNAMDALRTLGVLRTKSAQPRLAVGTQYQSHSVQTRCVLLDYHRLQEVLGYDPASCSAPVLAPETPEPADLLQFPG